MEDIAKIIFEKCAELGIEEAFSVGDWEDLPKHHKDLYLQIASAVENYQIMRVGSMLPLPEPTGDVETRLISPSWKSVIDYNGILIASCPDSPPVFSRDGGLSWQPLNSNSIKLR